MCCRKVALGNVTAPPPGRTGHTGSQHVLHAGTLARQIGAGPQGRLQACRVDRVACRLGAHPPGPLDLLWDRPSRFLRTPVSQLRVSWAPRLGVGSWLTKHSLGLSAPTLSLPSPKNSHTIFRALPV